MITMLKRILIGLAAIVLVFAFVVALLPSDFHKWMAWSPWAKGV
jgi:hypothetical protein